MRAVPATHSGVLKHQNWATVANQGKACAARCKSAVFLLQMVERRNR
jgi:hypothetical protein